MQVQSVQNQQNFNGRVFSLIPSANEHLKQTIELVKPELNKLLAHKDYNLGFFKKSDFDILEIAVSDATLAGDKPVCEKLYKSWTKNEFCASTIYENSKRLMNEYEKVNNYDSLTSRIKRSISKLFEML